MHELDFEREQESHAARYEESAFLQALFSANPGAREAFTTMFPNYETGEQEFDFFVPDSPEAVEELLRRARGEFT